MRRKTVQEGQSRRGARVNREMRQTLHAALDQLLDECMQKGWSGEIRLQASAADGVVQREYVSEWRREYRFK